ncbi:unnamed protein product, partial [Phyllotreta striolata]
MRGVVVILGFLVFISVTLALEINQHEINALNSRLKPSNDLMFEDRQAAKSHRSGILRIMEEIIKVMQTVLGLADGHNSVDDVVKSVQSVYIAMESFVNIKGFIREIPLIGPTVSWILSPILELVGSLLKNTPVFGELLKQLVVGPTYPATPPPPPPPPPTTESTGGGNIFGWG